MGCRGGDGLQWRRWITEAGTILRANHGISAAINFEGGGEFRRRRQRGRSMDGIGGFYWWFSCGFVRLVEVPVERGFGTGFFPSGFPYAALPKVGRRNDFEGHLEVFVDFFAFLEAPGGACAV
jgi:hypothetical protein